VQAAQGDLDGAIRRYEAVVKESAVHEYHLLLLEAKLADGRRAGAREEIAAIRENQAIERRNGVNTDAELAIFEADHGSPARAVALGRSAVEKAPSVSSADALSWALTSAGRGEEALRWANEALRTGWRDPIVRYHAGMAAKLAGERTLARRWLMQALALNPQFSPLHAPRAQRALESLG
jgi:tetratricopeptide (TPR) repeat protein